MTADERRLGPEAVLEHVDWVRALARRLVLDAASADDLAQETWLRALKSPPPQGPPLRAWLARVLRNAASERGRAEARRRGRERDAARSELEPSTDELQARVARERALVGLVMALEEPQRRTVLLRYFEGLSPRAIAAREGVPVATVKTRLRRALERLRVRLDAQHGGKRGAWMLAFASLVPREGAVIATGVVLMKSKLALLAACLFLLAGGWWLAHEGASGTAAAPDPGRSVSALDPAPAEVVGAGDLVPVAGTNARAQPIEAPAATRALRAVARESGETLEDAEFWYLSYRELSLTAKLGYAEEEVRERGTHVPAGPRAALPSDTPHSLVIAQAGELFGSTYVAPGTQDDVTVECMADRAIQVRVVDGDGRPVPGVDVELRSGSGLGADSVWTATTTAPDGLAALPHFDAGVGRRLERGTAYAFSFAFPMLDPPEVPLDLSAFPTTPIELTLPPTGSLEIELVDPAGAPFPVENWVHVTALGQGPTGGVERLEGFGRYLRGESRAPFAHVGLGLELFIHLQSRGVLRGVELRVGGPRQPGERVRAVLAVGDRFPSFKGRLVDEGGGPIDARYVEAEITFEDVERGARELGSRSHVETVGVFELPLEAPAVEGSTCRVTLVKPVSRRDTEALTGSFEARAPMEGETVDVGVVVLRRPPLIAAGTVVDASGTPLEGADLLLAEKFNQREDTGDFGWNFCDAGTAYTDAEGRFEVRGDVRPGEYAIWPRKNGYADRGLTRFEAGTSGLVLVMDAPASLAGSLVLPEGFPAQRLKFELEYRGASREETAYTDWKSSVQPSGSFAIERLRPGVVDWTLRTGRYSDPLFTVAGVTLEAGAECRDARLQGLDLREVLRLVELEVTGDGGAPVEHGFASLGTKHYGLEQGRLSVIARTDVQELEIVVPGYVSRRMQVPEEARRVELERGIPIDVRVPRDLVVPEPPYQLLVGLRPREEPTRRRILLSQDEDRRLRSGRRAFVDYAVVDGTADVRVHVPAAGDYYLSWLLWDPGGVYGGGSSSWVDPQHELVQVTEASRGSLIEAPLDAEDYARVLAEAR